MWERKARLGPEGPSWCPKSVSLPQALGVQIRKVRATPLAWGIT